MDKELLEVVENLVAIGIVDDRLDEFFGNFFVKSGDKAGNHGPIANAIQ